MSSTFDVTVGALVWLDGSMWTVQEIANRSVVVVQERRLRRVAIAALAEAHAQLGVDDGSTMVDSVPLALSRLASSKLSELKLIESALLEIIDSSDPSTSQTERVRTVAAREGVSLRTMTRRLADYRASGLVGLVDSSSTRKYVSSVDPRWDQACLKALSELVYESTPTKKAVLGRVQNLLDTQYGPGVVAIPSKSAAHRRLDELAKGRQAFGQGKARRSIAERPQGMYGRLRAQYPGEYVLMDSTPLDVFALEEGTGRWVSVELTVAIDLYSRCIVGLRLAPISTDARDIADVLYQVVVPPEEDADDGFPYHGVPHNLVIGTGDDHEPLGAVPGTIVVDHGKVYLSDHVRGACARIGINIQPATPHKPTDKPAVERFFRTLRQSFLEHLPGYKGPDVYSRGDNVENKAVYYVTELEDMIREWVTTVYHRSAHAGLCIPEVPGIELSPVEMFEAGLAKTGHLRLPASEDLVFDFLAVHWRTIQHYGVEIKGQRYDGVVLNKYRNVKSKERGANAGKWPFFYDTHDVRYVYFKDPDEHLWHRLDWEHAPMLDAPFSQKAADYAREVARRENRHVNPERAVFELLEKWRSKEILSRSDRNLSKRLMAKKRPGLESKSKPVNAPDPAAPEPGEGAVEATSRPQRSPKDQRVEERNSRVFDVFAEYYENNPDAELEVFE